MTTNFWIILNLQLKLVKRKASVMIFVSHLPHSPDRVKPGLAEVGVVPEVEEVVSLLLSGELLGLQPLVPPLPAKSREVLLNIRKTNRRREKLASAHIFRFKLIRAKK